MALYDSTVFRPCTAFLAILLRPDRYPRTGKCWRYGNELAWPLYMVVDDSYARSVSERRAAPDAKYFRFEINNLEQFD